jgi:nicotinamidase-related amidase
MKKSLGPLAAVVSVLAVAGCSPNGPQEGSGGGGGQAAGGDGGSAGGHGGIGGASGGSGGTGETGGAGSGGSVVAGTVGMVVIDVQQTFVAGAVDPDLTGILDRTKSAFQLATDSQIPFFLTFEGSKAGDHALYTPLQSSLPPQTQDFIKTTFAATGLPAFAGAVQQAGLSHVVVLGAETDVCVLQSVLGLRALGFTVLLQKDGVFTSETNTSPALRRMQQAGALLVDQAAVAAYVANPSALPKGPDVPVTITSPLHLGVVLNDFTDAAVGSSPDPWKTQKAARLRELLLVSEWFDLPVYVADVGAGLPAQFADYYLGQLRPMGQIAQDAFVTQLVVAGTDGSLAGAMPGWMASHKLFVMEDALLSLGTPAAQKEALQPFFDQGLVPTTYKSFYYDMTKSVDLAQWPSPVWVQKYDEYYQITQAPEDLPPIQGD